MQRTRYPLLILFVLSTLQFQSCSDDPVSDAGLKGYGNIGAGVGSTFIYESIEYEDDIETAREYDTLTLTSKNLVFSGKDGVNLFSGNGMSLVMKVDASGNVWEYVSAESPELFKVDWVMMSPSGEQTVTIMDTDLSGTLQHVKITYSLTGEGMMNYSIGNTRYTAFSVKNVMTETRTINGNLTSDSATLHAVYLPYFGLPGLRRMEKPENETTELRLIEAHLMP